MSASDQNSYMPFLRNEISKIFEDLFTMTLLSKMTHNNDPTKNKKLPEFDAGDILELFGKKMSSRK